jgi:hypothetical protein
MLTRRGLILASLLLLGASVVPALADTAPLQVTYYYLPG